MDIYAQKSRWKILLAIAGAVILCITIIYSKYLADRLAINEENNVQLFAQAITSLTDQKYLNDDANLPLSIVERLSNIPVIMEGEDGSLTGENHGDKNSDQEYLSNKREEILESGYEPIIGTGYASKIYYENSQLYRIIKLFPLVQFLLIGAFIALGYIGFSSARRGEQNRVWAGMAKETAHQLGTPLSAIMAWIEHLRDLNSKNNDQLEILDELSNDVGRLELIADRFSKIGSAPKLVAVNVYNELEECKHYMQRRASKKIVFDFPSKSKDLEININKHLFTWVIENLIRNALDSMGPIGTISAKISEEDNSVIIDLSDTGQGIAVNKFKTVFNPGFTTKKRGWGLGLSLAKRIIEEYHNGKIFVKSSKINEGTTFRIKLPKVISAV